MDNQRLLKFQRRHLYINALIENIFELLENISRSEQIFNLLIFSQMNQKINSVESKNAVIQNHDLCRFITEFNYFDGCVNSSETLLDNKINDVLYELIMLLRESSCSSKYENDNFNKFMNDQHKFVIFLMSYKTNYVNRLNDYILNVDNSNNIYIPSDYVLYKNIIKMIDKITNFHNET